MKKINLVILALLLVLVGMQAYFLWGTDSEEEEIVEETEVEEVEEVKEVEEVEEEVTFESVSSIDYDLKIPVLEGFEFLNQGGNYEFTLSKTDGSMTFYFESDYSPGAPENEVRKSWPFKRSDGKELVINTLTDSEEQSGVLYFVEDGLGFEFSVSLDRTENFEENKALIEKIINQVEYEKIN